MPPPHASQTTTSQAVVLAVELDEAGAAFRHYFEFFVTPEGTFDLPPMVFALNATGHNVIYSQSLSPHLLLGIRHMAMGGAFADAEPDVEIWTRLHTENQDPSTEDQTDSNERM